MKLLAFFTFIFFGSVAFTQESADLKRVKLAWDEVEDSKSYELEIYKEEVLLLQEKLTSLMWQGDLGPASYKYRVRAIDEFNRPGEWTALASFSVKIVKTKVNPDVVKKKLIERNASLGIHAAWSSYKYKNQVSGIGSGKLDGGTSLGLGADLDFWLWNRLGVELSGTHNSSSVQSVDVSYAEFSLALKYALLTQSRIFLNPLLSLEYQYTPEFFVDTAALGALKANLVRSMGMGVGLEFGSLLSDSWLLGAHARYIQPYSLEGDAVGKSSPDSATFYRYGLKLQYYWVPQWLLGIELGGDYRELKYQLNNKKQIEKDELRFILFTRYVFGSSQ